MPVKSRRIRRLLKKKGPTDLDAGDPLRHAMVCRAKERVYDSEAEAMADVERLVRDEGFDPSVVAFHCHHCRRWHIGRPRRKDGLVKTCPVIGCSNLLDRSWNLVCKGHWFDIPKPLRDEVWRLFKNERGSDAHMAAVAECLIYLNGLRREQAS